MSEINLDQTERNRLNKHRLIVREHISDIETANQHDKLCTLFYTHLFRINPDLTEIFDGGAPMLNRKFTSMLTTFKNLKDLEKLAAAMESMAVRHVGYHAEAAHFPQFKEAVILSLKELLEDNFTNELQLSWESVFDEVSSIMTKVIAAHPDTGKYKKSESVHQRHLYEDIGGTEKIHAVHKRFYDYIYDDDYLNGFFQHRSKDLLIRKQSEFMIAAFGGPNEYHGQPPAFIHMHMFVTKEMSDIRNTYLRNAILEEGLSMDICEQWLKIDQSFHSAIEKKTIDECVMRVPGQFPMSVKKPLGYKPPKEFEEKQ